MIKITRKAVQEGTSTKVPKILKKLVAAKVENDPDKIALFESLWEELINGEREEITMDDLNV